MPEINDKKGVKIITFYLPQYHQIPENDVAWGKGFTEWVNVKKAKPLFKGHHQPKIPLNKNYYSLLNRSTQEWQSNLALNYGITGFCYYHYWFKDGKKLLEKPAENMLDNPNIKIPFCFCWANENWTKNWDGGNRELIVEQDYGDSNEWEKHFQYLLKFFKDPRYLLYDNSPILIIYKPELIKDFKNMSLYFKKRCIENGFSGCEIMIQYPNYINSTEYDESAFDHYIYFEPAYTILQDKSIDINGNVFTKIKKNIKSILGPTAARRISERSGYANRNLKLQKFDYDKQWKLILERKYNNPKFIAGAFTDWDNTARNKNGTLHIGACPQKFGYYLKQLLTKIENSELPKIIFINAWNEWGEGAYLEPDEKYDYGYLEEIKNIMENL